MVAKIHVTGKKLEEIKNIRNEIKNAVQNGLYLNNNELPITTPQARLWFPNFGFLRNLFSLGENIEKDTASVGQVLAGNKNSSTADSKPFDKFLENALSNLTQNIEQKYNTSDTINITPNIVESNVALNSIKNVHSSSNLNRENLEISSVTEDTLFTLGDNVLAWKSLQTYSHGINAIIGMTNNSLVLVSENNGTYKLNYELQLNANILCFTIFSKWHQGSIIGIAVVAIENQLLFIQIDKELQNMEIVWNWVINKMLISVVYFKTNDLDMIVLTNQFTAASSNLSSADIYEFDVITKQTWLMQKIPLDIPSASVELLDVGRELVLCFAQNDKVHIYKCPMGFEHKQLQFNYFISIPSPKLKTISTFQMGGISYIAIGGRRPQIMRYYRGEFYAQTILDKSWGLVEKMVPLPARTYRDDLILLVQHRIDFETHSIPVLEALVWNGAAFDTTALSVPCHIGNIIVRSGITCILDSDRDDGIAGASVIQKSNDISILVPRFEAPSALYHIKFQLLPIPNPDEVDEYQKAELNTVIKYQDDVIATAKELFLNITADENREYKGHWTIDMVDTEEFRMENESNWKIDEIWLGEHLLTNEDFEANISDLLDLLVGYQNELNEIEQSNNDNVPNQLLEPELIRNTKDLMNSKAPANGKFNLESLHILKPETIASVKLESSSDIFANSSNLNNTEELINKIPEPIKPKAVEKIADSLTDTMPPVISSSNGQFSIENLSIIPSESVIKENIAHIPVLNEPQQVYRSMRSAPHLPNLNVQHLNVEFINGIPVKDFLFHENGKLDVGDSTIVVAKDFEVVKEVILKTKATENSDSIIGDFIEHDKSSEPSKHNLHVTGDISFDYINGIAWNKFVNDIVLVNVPIFLRNLELTGVIIINMAGGSKLILFFVKLQDLVVKDNVTIRAVNNFSFPSDFVFKNNKSETLIIKGTKYFNGTMGKII